MHAICLLASTRIRNRWASNLLLQVRAMFMCKSDTYRPVSSLSCLIPFRRALLFRPNAFPIVRSGHVFSSTLCRVLHPGGHSPSLTFPTLLLAFALVHGTRHKKSSTAFLGSTRLTLSVAYLRVQSKTRRAKAKARPRTNWILCSPSSQRSLETTACDPSTAS